MELYILLIIISTTALLVLAAAYILYRHHKRMEREKNRRIMEHIRRNDRIARELERTQIEKEVLEKALRMKMEKAGEHSDKAEEDRKE